MYQLTEQVPLRESQLEFTGHYICMLTDEPANRFVVYETMTSSSLRPGDQVGYISIKFRRTFYNLAKKLLKSER